MFIDPLTLFDPPADLAAAPAQIPKRYLESIYGLSMTCLGG